MNNQNLKKENLVGVKRIENYSYCLTDQIGRGYSSSVYKGKDDRTNQFCAIKVIELKKLEEDIHKQLLKSQISCLTELRNCQNILRLIEVFSTVNNKYIVTELCEGKDLAKLARARKQMSQEEAVAIMKQLINGYMDIYRNGIVHRDLKPANIFFKKGVLKIADFGFAIKQINCAKQKQYNLGSPTYMSPEALKQNSYSYKSDIWALGVILFELLNGKVPWKTKSDAALLKKLIDQPIQTLISPDIKISQSSVEFMKRCCCPNLTFRMSPQELALFEWKPISTETDTQNLTPLQNNIASLNRPQSVAISDYNEAIGTPILKHVHKQRLQTIYSEMPSTPMKRQNRFITEIGYTTKTQANENIKQPQNNPFIISEKTFTEQYNQQTSHMIQEIGNSKQAQAAIISQIHYCRFTFSIIVELQKIEERGFKKDLTAFLKLELQTKIGMLMKTAVEEKNYFNLKGFNQLIKTGEWKNLKEMIQKYNSKFIAKIGLDTNSNLNEPIIFSAIKELNYEGRYLGLLDKLVNFYQIKQLEKKIDYNSFGQKTKIQLITDCRSPVQIARIRNKIQILGI